MRKLPSCLRTCGCVSVEKKKKKKEALLKESLSESIPLVWVVRYVRVCVCVGWGGGGLKYHFLTSVVFALFVKRLGQ